MDNGASEPRECDKTRPLDQDETPREVDGRCSRCGKPWPCLTCLTMTPPYVPVWNNL